MRDYLTFEEIGEAIAEYYIGNHKVFCNFGKFVLETYLPSVNWPELQEETDEYKATTLLWNQACAKTVCTIP